MSIRIQNRRHFNLFRKFVSFVSLFTLRDKLHETKMDQMGKLDFAYPLILFVILMVLLYIPPVQNFLRKEAAAYASEATGMQINVRRIDLRFPLNLLVRGVEVIQAPDTLLSLESLNVHVQALPLFRGKVEVDDISLQQVAVNSANLIDGMRLKGVLGSFRLESHGVDLPNRNSHYKPGRTL